MSLAFTTGTAGAGTTTTDETTMDNSSTLLGAEPSTDDNSTSTGKGGEPENVADEAVKTDKADDNASEGNDDEVIEIPEKFKDKDGNVDLKKLAKAYKELEPVVTQKANLEREKETLQKQADEAKEFRLQQDELAKSYGFKNIDELKTYQQEVKNTTKMAEFEANAYAEHLERCDDPVGVRQLLIAYAQNPTKELLAEIEDIFPADVNKKVGEVLAVQKAEFQQQNANLAYQEEATKAEAFLQEVTTTHKELFQNKAIVNLFGEAFLKFGTNLDMNKFKGYVDDLKQSFIAEYVSEQGQKNENNEALKTLEGLSPNTKTVVSTPKNVDLNKIDDKKLSEYVSNLI